MLPDEQQPSIAFTNRSGLGGPCTPGRMMRARRGGGGEGGVRNAVLIWILAIAIFSAGLSLLTQHHATYELHEPLPTHADAHAKHHRHHWDDHRSLHAERRHRHVADDEEEQGEAADEQVYADRLDNPQCVGRIHVIISTVCDPYFDWQTEGLLYSHYVTGMRGTITRIVSCSHTNYQYPKRWHPCFDVHTLKDMSGQVSTYNKAFAMKDFFESGLGARLLDHTVVVLLDADMILLNALDSPDLADAAKIAAVTHGKPLAQMYGLGSAWLTKERDVMDKVGHPTQITSSEALKHFQVGPPHFMTARDWRLASPRWAEYAKAMWDKYKPNFPWDADMFAFNMALLSVQVFHEQSTQLMVSDPAAADGSEGWGALQLGDDRKSTYQRLPVPSPMPADYVPANTGHVPIIHYCQFLSVPKDGLPDNTGGPQAEKGQHLPGYSFGKYDYREGFDFAKRGQNLLKCGKDATDIYMANPTLAEEVWRAWESEGRAHADYQSHTKRTWIPKLGGHRQTLPGGLEDRRRVFLIREITLWLNAALRHHRTVFCGAAGAGAIALPGGGGGGGAGAMAVVTERAADGRRRVAVAVTVVEDGPQADGAVLLARSVRALYDHHPNFQVELLAIVSPKVQRMLPVLRQAGYRLVPRDVPVTPEQLRNEAFRKSAPTSGCCGLGELLKLEAWTLTEFWKVVLLDMDTLLVARVDELLENTTPIIFTVSGGNTNEGLQGGMIIVRPDVSSYNAILEVIREGDFHYDGSGWAGSGIGYSYGGETIQGVLPYYYAKKAPPGSYQVVDHCVYNNMGDSEQCLNMPVGSVKLFHFTVCQKPWYCLPGARVCRQAQEKWWQLRNEYEDELRVPRVAMCTAKFDYVAIEHPAQDNELFRNVQHGCATLPGGCAKF